MIRALKKLLLYTILFAVAAQLKAQTCNPTATFTYANDEGEQVTEELESYSGSAPVKVEFRANPEDEEDCVARYEWIIYETGNETNIIVHRFDENIEYTFLHSGSFTAELKATFVEGADSLFYPAEGEDPVRFSISVSESHLEMPNAFSPGDNDDFNKIYKAKDNHKSIVEFKATIFNRWGQRLYSWNDINGGWDGRYKGKIVPDGVYFVNVVAKGADGRVYHIRKDVNVLTKYTEMSGGGGEQ